MLLGLDIETFDPCLKDKGVSYVYGQGEILCVCLYSDGLEIREGENIIKDYLLDEKNTIAGCNIYYDLGWVCACYGIEPKQIKAKIWDVMIAESHINEHNMASLAALTERYLNEKKGIDKIAEIAKSMRLQGDARAHLKEVCDAGYKSDVVEYCLSDARQAFRIAKAQKIVLEKMNYSGMKMLAIDMELVKMCLQMKFDGIKIDAAKRNENKKILEDAIEQAKKEFCEKYGKFELSSDNEFRKMLDALSVPYDWKVTVQTPKAFDAYKRLKYILPNVRIESYKCFVYASKSDVSRIQQDIFEAGFTSVKSPNVNQEYILSLPAKYSFVKDAYDIKTGYEHLKGFFGDEFGKYIANDGKVHADFKVVGARKTGRMSVENPALQSIPSKIVLFEGKEYEIVIGKLERECFVADKTWASFDWKGQENRIMAHYSIGKEGEMIKAEYRLDANLDEHDKIGAETGLYDKYGKERGRKYIKSFRFGKCYGMGRKSMQKKFGWDDAKLREIEDAFNCAAPHVKDLFEMTESIIKERGYIRTLGGRHLRLGKQDGSYMALNKLTQGSGADMLKMVLYSIWKKDLESKVILVEHDEIILDLSNDGEKEIVKSIMENGLLSVPTPVDIEIGSHWGV